jgi:hypothetical protein
VEGKSCIERLLTGLLLPERGTGGAAVRAVGVGAGVAWLPGSGQRSPPGEAAATEETAGRSTGETAAGQAGLTGDKGPNSTASKHVPAPIPRRPPALTISVTLWADVVVLCDGRCWGRIGQRKGVSVVSIRRYFASAWPGDSAVWRYGIVTSGGRQQLRHRTVSRQLGPPPSSFPHPEDKSSAD